MDNSIQFVFIDKTLSKILADILLSNRINSDLNVNLSPTKVIILNFDAAIHPL